MILHSHKLTCAYHQCYNLHKKAISLLQSIFTNLFHPYFFTKSSLQYPLTFPSSIPQQFSTSLFLHTPNPIIYTKNIFSTSVILPIYSASMHQGVRGSCEVWNYFNLFRLPQGMESDNRAHNHWFFIAQTQKIGVLLVWQTIESNLSHTFKLLPLLPYLTNTTTRTYIPLKNSYLTWFSS